MDGYKIQREHNAITYALEKKALVWLGLKMPTWVMPDHLTSLGIIASLIIGVSYLLAKDNYIFLYIAAFGWILHWFGDSLDGTVARVRHIERPCYGHYLDHFVDTLVTCFMAMCFAFSGFVNVFIWLFVLISYYLLSIHSYLLAAVSKKFKISFGIIGPTELRIFFIISSIFLPFLSVKFFINNWQTTIIDLLGFALIISLLTAFIVSGIKTARELDKQDRESAN